MTRAAPVALLAAALLAVGVAASSHPQATPANAAAPRANIVFVLTDDLSWNLVNRRFAPHIADLMRRGETFTRYFVSDSLCCPSRSTIFTGLFPHDTHVLTNVGANGGFDRFQEEHLYEHSYAVALRRRGYRTSMLGKYLNGYGRPTVTAATAPIPPGWSDWHVAGNGYREFDYDLQENGTINHYGGPTGGCGTTGTPDDYGVDVVSDRARSFIHASRGRPFVVEAATFAPHKPYTPAPRNACDFPGLTEPRDASFNTPNTNAPAWLAARKPLTDKQIQEVDHSYRKRAQAVEAVDKLVADVEAQLAADHLLSRTYIVFSSDNGYHMGQHQMLRGKQTAFDTDIRVPLVVAGPGVPHGRTVTAVAQNVDLYPTFVDLAGGTSAPSVEGHSLVPLLHPGARRPPWRTVALVEHHGLSTTPGDPDYEDGRGSGDPPTYEAIRVSARTLPHFHRPVNAVYVEYATGEREFYDLRTDPLERHNTVASLSPAQRGELHDTVARLRACHTGRACWAAGLPA